MRGIVLFSIVLIGAATSGCVQRTLTVKSNPPEALVYLNGMEVGRTPVTRDFTWYGWYDVELRKEGFETLKTKGNVIAPWWQWVPLDLFAEALPLRDKQWLSYTLRPTPVRAVDPEKLLDRGETMRGELESSAHTRKPGSTRPSKKKTTAPAH
jgi:hypothetical protein